MKVEVLLFARARDAAGADRLALELPESARVGDLRRAMVSSHPGLAGLAPCLHVAVDNQYADDRTTLSQRSVIACFPPVSGG